MLSNIHVSASIQDACNYRILGNLHTVQNLNVRVVNKNEIDAFFIYQRIISKIK